VIGQRHRVIETMGYIAFSPSHKLMMELHDKGRVWVCSFPFQEAPQDSGTSKMVSLVDCQRDVNMDYMFPQWCTGVESEDRLVAELKVAAALDCFSKKVLPCDSGENIPFGDGTFTSRGCKRGSCIPDCSAHSELSPQTSSEARAGWSESQLATESEKVEMDYGEIGETTQVASLGTSSIVGRNVAFDIGEYHKELAGERLVQYPYEIRELPKRA
jgi:hypothetical protein